MRRIYTALALLVIAAILCTAEFICVRDNAEKYIGKIEEIEATVRNGDTSTAMEYAEEINTQWRDTASVIDMLLYHDYVDSIGQELSVMTSYIEQEDEAELYATCKRAKKQLTSLKDSEKPTVENII